MKPINNACCCLLQTLAPNCMFIPSKGKKKYTNPSYSLLLLTTASALRIDPKFEYSLKLMPTQWSEMWDQLCGLSISKYLCYCFSPEPEIEAPPPKKDWFLYLMMNKRICRLYIDEFCQRNSPKPQFEVVHDYYPDDNYLANTTIPLGMQPIVVGSKVYMLGGESTRMSDPESNEGGESTRMSDPESNDCRLRERDNSRVPNLDVFAFDPNDSEGATISLCDGRTIPRLIDPRLIDPKTLRSGPIVFTLEDKIYVMARGPYLGDEEDIDYKPPLFKVFDPLHQFWKELPHPPHCDNAQFSSFYDHSTWGHKLLTRAGYRSGYSIFDTHEEKWEDWPMKEDDQGNNRHMFKDVVEFEGFLIGVEYQQLVVYKLDTNGIPEMYRDLHELQGIFCPFLLVTDCLMGKCDGGRMWLVYCGKDLMEFWCTRVAVFRVSISEDVAGNRVLSAQLEAAEFYAFPGCFNEGISSAFSMCHHSNNHNIEEKNLCGKIIAHDHPRG